MEIHHKIKPLHGWREFIGEVGIVMLGVLIALGAEQVVETLHWRHQVEAGREVLATDLAAIFESAKERELYSKCLARRLRDIAMILDQAQLSGRLPPVGPLGNPSNRGYALPSWTTLSASSAGAHFPRDELLQFGSIADYGTTLSATNLAEFEDWSRLYAIVGPGRPIGEAELGELRAALSRAGYHAKLMRIGAYQIKDQIKMAGLPLDREWAKDWPKTYAKRKKNVASRPICQPLGPAPDHYGDSPFFYSLDGPIEG